MGKQKLGRAAVLNIRAAKVGTSCPMCGQKLHHTKKLSNYHGVSRSTIRRIRRGEHYKRVT